MAIRINADLQAIYIYEPAGHTVPAMNGAWTIAGEVVIHSDVDLPSIIVTRYLDATPSGWAGSYYASDGSTHYIYNNPGTGQVASSPWTMGPGRYSYSLHYNGSNLIQVRVDGVLMVEFSATVPAGTNGARSVQWGGFGTPMLAGYMDSTWQRWRMWTADLTPLECFAEFRSATPVRTSGLIHDWPMDAGSTRLNDTVSGEPDLLDNPSVPCGDGTDIPLQTGQRVYYGAAGTSASGTASCTPAYPSGISSSTSDLFLLVTGRSNDAGTAFGVPAGWTLASGSELEGGTGTWAADTGTRRVALYKKDTVAGTETGTISVTLGGAVTTNNTLRATIFRTERPSGTTLQVVATTGADTTNGTGFSATGSSSLAFDVGDLVMVGVAQNIDTGTQSAVSLTASGIGFSPRQNVRSDAVTNGNDHRHILDAFHVMSGTATVAPVYAYTISAAGSGPASFVRMRAVTAATVVSASYSGSWSVRNLASSTKAGAWSVWNIIAATKVGAWSVRAIASASFEGAFSVRTGASATLASVWTVRNYANGSKAGAWSVVNLVSSSHAGAWSVRTLAAATIAGSWSVRSLVTGSAAGAWSVRNLVTGGYLSAWSVEEPGIVTAVFGGSWTVRNSASETQVGAWSVRNIVSATKAGAWSARNLASGTKSGAWTIRVVQSATFGGAWSVQEAGLATGTYASGWSVRNRIQATIGSGWSVRASVASSLPGAWSVRNSASRTWAGGWSVRALASGSFPGSWSVEGVAQAFFSGAWSVESDVPVEIDPRFIAKPTPRNWVAGGSGRPWKVHT